MNAHTIEQTILNRRLPHPLPGGEGGVALHYDGLSIANLPTTPTAWLTGENVAALTSDALPGALPPLPDAVTERRMSSPERIVLIILNALGYRLL